ncbi:MAG: UDP-4-amino-4,6-dideoxy-N-acetyl-beta-L-altrosamine transaminase [Saprospiraceae bacterium]
MSFQRIPYGRHHITEEDLQAVSEALKADFITQGPRVEQFEQQFAEYVGAKYAVANSNGTAALHLCAMALGVNENSKVITTPITFAASANCVKFCGGEIVFSDIDPSTALLDLTKVRSLLEAAPPNTYHGIIPVDFTGYPVDLEAFRQLADEFNLWIIQDSCHSPGGFFMDSGNQKQRCGNGHFADLAIFSFHPVKHIACGEGGMVTTNSFELYEKLLMYRNHGITKEPTKMSENHGGWFYEMQLLGYNYRMTEAQAALGSSQLQRAEKGLERRREIAQIYDKVFADNKKITLMRPTENIGHAYHLYVIQVDDRKALYEYLREHNILSQIHYIPVHTLPYYRSLQSEEIVMPNAERYYDRCISLPMFPTLTDEEQQFVIEKVLAFVGE